MLEEDGEGDGIGWGLMDNELLADKPPLKRSKAVSNPRVFNLLTPIGRSEKLNQRCDIWPQLQDYSLPPSIAARL